MDIRHILSSPRIYIAFQKLVGGFYLRDLCIHQLSPQRGERILDIGCGPAYYLEKLPPVDYVGFDTNEKYILYAKSRFGERGRFYCEEFSQAHAQQLAPFDCVLLMGLLHHLDDNACQRLLRRTASILSPAGRIVTLDTALFHSQNKLESFLAKNDRGHYVRTPTALTSIAKTIFSSVEGVTPKVWWIPTIYWQMILRKPHTS